MNQVAIVFWSGSGNTEKMANCIADGVKEAGGEAVLLGPAEFSADAFASYGAVAFGCPSMGSEQLEESEFEPMFAALEGSLASKKIALFGSYGWGDGQWMRDWQERVSAAGALLYNGEGLMVHEPPDGTALAACAEFGESFAKF